MHPYCVRHAHSGHSMNDRDDEDDDDDDFDIAQVKSEPK